MRARRWLLAGAGAVYAVFWVGGIYTRLPGAKAQAPGWAAPFFLVLSALIAALSCCDLRAVAIFALGGFVAELVGVHAGLPFGAYTYTAALGPALGGVPLVIACAWVTLLVWARDLAWRTTQRLPAAILTGAALMTAADLLIDPVASRLLGYWRWQQGGFWFGVPAINFAGWFFVSALLLIAGGKPVRTSRGSAAIGVATLAFFVSVLAIRTRG